MMEQSIFEKVRELIAEACDIRSEINSIKSNTPLNTLPLTEWINQWQFVMYLLGEFGEHCIDGIDETDLCFVGSVGDLVEVIRKNRTGSNG